MFTRALRADVSLRDITITRDGKRGYRVQTTSRTESVRRILGIGRKLVELRLDTKREGLTFASLLPHGGLGQMLHEMGGGRLKSQNRKIVSLSPYVEKPLNSKVIKSFVPELRSRKCFSCFEIPIFYVYNIICPFHTWPYLAMVHRRPILSLTNYVLVSCKIEKYIFKTVFFSSAEMYLRPPEEFFEDFIGWVQTPVPKRW